MRRLYISLLAILLGLAPQQAFAVPFPFVGVGINATVEAQVFGGPGVIAPIPPFAPFFPVVEPLPPYLQGGPPGGADFIYAYKVYNFGFGLDAIAFTPDDTPGGTAISFFSVGILPAVVAITPFPGPGTGITAVDLGADGGAPFAPIAFFTGYSAITASVKGSLLAPLPAGGVSEILYFTSPLGPGFAPAVVVDGGASAANFLPSPVREPGTLLLLGSGLVGLSAAAWRRPRRK